MEGTTLWIQAGSLGGVTVNHVRGDLSLQIPCLALETNLADGSLLLMDGGFSLCEVNCPCPPLWLVECVHKLLLASSIPTLMEEGRSYVSKLPLTLFRQHHQPWSKPKIG